MKRYFLFISLFFLFTGCQNAAQFITPGSFDANKTADNGGKYTDGSEDSAGSDKIVSTDLPASPPASTPPPGSPTSVPPPPEAIGKLPPIGGDSPQGSGSDRQMVMYRNPSNTMMGPFDPKNDYEGVFTATRHYRFRYGPDFSLINSHGWEDGLSDAPRNEDGTLNLKLLLEKSVLVKKSEVVGIPDEYNWFSEEDGPQIRLVFRSMVKPNWESQYCDGIIAKAPEGHNVSFPNPPLGPGFISFFLIKKPHASLFDWFPPPPGYAMTSDFSADLIPFPDKAAYDAFLPFDEYAKREGVSEMAFVGDFQVAAPPQQFQMMSPR